MQRIKLRAHRTAAEAAQTALAKASLAATVTIARHNSVRAEIQWRGIQRDLMQWLGFTIIGVAMGSYDKLGLWVLGASFPIVYLAANWYHHDNRIGWLDHYERHVTGPAMQRLDGLVSLSEYLNDHDPSRSFAKRLHFTAIMSRLLFPTLMGIPLVAVVAWLTQVQDFADPRVFLVITVSLLTLAAVTLTGKNVKVVRQP